MGKYNNLAAAAMISGSLALPMAAQAQEEQVPEPVTQSQGVSGTQEPAAAPSGIFEGQNFLERAGSPVNFTNPWMLGFGALGMLILWNVLRSETKKLKDVQFAPLFILEELKNDKTSRVQMRWLEKMPWIAGGALVSAFAAGAVWTGLQQDLPEGDLIIALDGDWAMASKWEQIYRPQIHELIERAHENGSEICFVNMAGQEDGTPPGVTEKMSAERAYSYIESFSPQPWEANRNAALKALNDMDCDNVGSTFWFTNGLHSDGALDFAAGLNNIAPLTAYNEIDRATLMMVPKLRNDAYHITVKRADIAPEDFTISAYTKSYKNLGTMPVTFEQGQSEATIVFDPSEFGTHASSIFSFSLDEEASAGAMALINNDFTPRSVGIASTSSSTSAGTFVSEEFFLNKALEDTTKTYLSNLEALVTEGNISVLVVPDSTPITKGSSLSGKVQDWVENGGTLVRFAGSNLSATAHQDDPLLPVNLQPGTINFGQSVASNGDVSIQNSFNVNSIFSYLDIESPVPVVQIANVERDLPEGTKVEARLNNGQPFVTSADRGQGRVILFHVPATPVAWSDFPISETFYDMLVSIIENANSVENTENYAIPEMPALSVLDGKGQLANPSSIVEPLTQEILDSGLVNARHRAGIYGTALQAVPYNLAEAIPSMVPMDRLPQSVTVEEYKDLENEGKIKDYLLAAAIAAVTLASVILNIPRNNNVPATPDKKWGRKEKQYAPAPEA